MIEFFKAAQTSILSNRNCLMLLVKMITASPIARVVIFVSTRQIWPPHLGRNCGPFYPRPPCSQISHTASSTD